MFYYYFLLYLTVGILITAVVLSAPVMRNFLDEVAVALSTQVDETYIKKVFTLLTVMMVVLWPMFFIGLLANKQTPDEEE